MSGERSGSAQRHLRPERPARLALDGWEGRSYQDVIVVGETAKRYRIRCATDMAVRLAGKWRMLYPGHTALVPKYAIHFAKQPVSARPVEEPGEKP